jgi:hypothetical protein
MKNSCQKPTRLNIILAFCLIAIGLFVNPWLLGYLVRPASIPFAALVFIGAFEIFLIISGLLVYFKGNTAKERKQLAFGYVRTSNHPGGGRFACYRFCSPPR